MISNFVSRIVWKSEIFWLVGIFSTKSENSYFSEFWCQHVWVGSPRAGSRYYFLRTPSVFLTPSIFVVLLWPKLIQLYGQNTTLNAVITLPHMQANANFEISSHWRYLRQSYTSVNDVQSEMWASSFISRHVCLLASLGMLRREYFRAGLRLLDCPWC